MAVTLKQTANAGDCSAPNEVYCASATADADAVDREIASDGNDTTALTGPTVSYTEDDRVHFIFVYPAGAAGYNFAGGSGYNWSVDLDVTTAGDFTWTEVYVCRVNASCVSQEVLASKTGMTVDMNSTGTKQSGTFEQSSTPSYNNDDVICIVVVLDCDAAHGNHEIVLRVDNAGNAISAPGEEVAASENINVKQHRGALQEVF